MPQLDISVFPPQIIWLLITFIVLYIVMSRVALPRIGSILEQRQNKIDDCLDTAEALRNESNADAETYEKMLNDSREQARLLIYETSKTMSQESIKQHEELSNRLSAEATSAERRISIAKEEALSTITVVAGEVASDAVELLIEIKNEYPEPDKMIEAHQYWVDKSGEHIKSNNLIPIPWKERVQVVPREEYLRKTSYYGNFSRTKGVDNEGFFTSKWKINPFEDRWDQKTKDEYLVEHDWGVIIVTAPHETYAGHHIQGLYQMHNPRELRRNNGLSLFSEGWGLYNEQLMLETGFYPNKKIELRQLQLRLWRNARVIYDVGMHTGKLSYEEAIRLMTDKVGFLRWAAQLEIDSSSSRPGYFIGYFIGMTEILKMREDYKKIKGDQFNISEFHERLLKIGNMPPSLMKEALFNF